MKKTESITIQKQDFDFANCQSCFIITMNTDKAKNFASNISLDYWQYLSEIQFVIDRAYWQDLAFAMQQEGLTTSLNGKEFTLERK